MDNGTIILIDLWKEESGIYATANKILRAFDSLENKTTDELIQKLHEEKDTDVLADFISNISRIY